MLFYADFYRHGCPKKHTIIINDIETCEMMKRLLIHRMDICLVEFTTATGRVFYKWENKHGNRTD